MEPYVVSESERKTVRALFGVDDDRVAVLRKNVMKWLVEERPDLPVEMREEGFVEIMLLRGKFQEERIKKNIENFYKYIVRYPKIFQTIGIKSRTEDYQSGMVFSIPKLTPKGERIVVYRMFDDKSSVEDFDLGRCLAVALTAASMAFYDDYFATSVIVLDFKRLEMKHVLQISPKFVYNLVVIYQKILKVSIGGLELVNTSAVMSAILNLLKMSLPPKLFSRITVHSDLDSLHKNVSKDFLPNEYGGTFGTCDELMDTWDRLVEDIQPFFEKIIKLSKEGDPNEIEDCDIFGPSGTFKSLAID